MAAAAGKLEKTFMVGTCATRTPLAVSPVANAINSPVRLNSTSRTVVSRFCRVLRGFGVDCFKASSAEYRLTMPDADPQAMNCIK